MVQRGNTLWNIAQMYHSSVHEIKEDNHLQSDMLQIHQVLRIPRRPDNTVRHGVQKSQVHGSMKPVSYKSDSYRVRSGDTLWGIAMANHVSVSYLMTMNALSSSLIFPGQKLTVHGHPQNPPLKMTSVQIKGGPPTQLIPVYQAAGQRYGVPWTVLAAIHRVETNFSTHRLVSSEGAEGPMQFMPATFEFFGVTAPGQHGRPNINNVYDAIYSCAHMLAFNGYAKHPWQALYLYNHSAFYVQRVLMFAQDYQRSIYQS